MSFIQIIEYETDKADEIEALGREMEDSDIPSRVTWLASTKDRDKANAYVTIVEFPSYEEAMQNSTAPETQRFAARMADLCTAPPVFHNLDVMRELS